MVRNLRDLRTRRRESQTAFWCRFGVSQSRGSRFEQGVGMPPAVAILVKLYLANKVGDSDLLHAPNASRLAETLQSQVDAVLCQPVSQV